MSKLPFLARYGGVNQITKVLNSDASDNTKTNAIENPNSTRHHVDMVLKNPHAFGEYTKAAVVRHPSITVDDLRTIVKHHYADPTNIYASRHVMRAIRKLDDKHHLEYNFETKDFDNTNDKLLKDLSS